MSEFARRFVASMAAQLLPTRGQRIRKCMVRQLLPYCVVMTARGPLFLNRNYKPIGWPTEGRSWVDYNDKMFDSVRLEFWVGPDHAEAAGLHQIVNKDGEFWFFYGGPKDAPWQGSIACRDYLECLEAFIERPVSVEGEA